ERVRGLEARGVATRARIPVPVPRATDVVAHLVHAELQAEVAQLVGEEHPGEPGTRDHGVVPVPITSHRGRTYLHTVRHRRRRPLPPAAGTRHAGPAAAPRTRAPCTTRRGHTPHRFAGAGPDGSVPPVVVTARPLPPR